MSKAFQCDRCLAFSLGDPLMSVTVKLVDGLNTRSTDTQLCNPCLQAFHVWRDEPKPKIDPDTGAATQ